MSNINQKAKFGTELSIDAATFDGSTQLVGTITQAPVVVVFQNDTDQEVFLSDEDSSTLGKTFVEGERIVIDSRANHGIADNFAFPANTSFYATGAVGTGSFKISYLYAQ